jgi:hypothetical protein
MQFHLQVIYAIIIANFSVIFGMKLGFLNSIPNTKMSGTVNVGQSTVASSIRSHRAFERWSNHQYLNETWKVLHHHFTHRGKSHVAEYVHFKGEKADETVKIYLGPIGNKLSNAAVRYMAYLSMMVKEDPLYYPETNGFYLKEKTANFIVMDYPKDFRPEVIKEAVRSLSKKFIQEGNLIA